MKQNFLNLGESGNENDKDFSNGQPTHTRTSAAVAESITRNESTEKDKGTACNQANLIQTTAIIESQENGK